MLNLGGDDFGKQKSYKEFRDALFSNIISKHDSRCNGIKSNSLKKEDKIKLLNKLKEKIETTLLIINNT